MHKEEIAYSKGYHIRPDGTAIGIRGYPLKTRKNDSGRLYFTIRNINKTTTIRIHRLQAYQKFGQKLFEPGIEVRHKDNNCLNNSADNILIGTHSQNIMDLPEETRIRYAKNAADKLKSLTDQEVRQLREDRKYMTYKELMAKYGLAKSTVSYIVNRKTYADIQ